MAKLMDLTGQKFGRLHIEGLAFKKHKKAFWTCVCHCGRRKVVPSGHLKSGHTASCGCLNKEITHKRALAKSKVGQRFSKLLVLERLDKAGASQKNQTKYLCKCDCGELTIKWYSELQKSKKEGVSCGCLSHRLGVDNPNYGGYGEITGKYFNSIKSGAEVRNLPFEISIKDMLDLFIKQERKCKLSGQDIELKPSKYAALSTASLDRIDSSKGYTRDNIQWVHKDINKMKQDLPEDIFISHCRQIVNQYERNSK